MAGEEKAIAQINAIAHIDVKKVQEAVLKLIYEESQRLVPVDEGDLKESGRYNDEYVEYGTDHAKFVEFGTVKMKAQPYLRPAAMNQESRLAREAAAKIEQLEKEAV